MTKDETLTDSRLLWTDIESTGLTDDMPGGLWNDGMPLEVCLLLTTGHLDYLAHKSLVVHWPAIALHNMRRRVLPVVHEMHTGNGLWAEAEQPGPGLVDVEDELLAWLDQWDVKSRTLPMCGSSVHTDRQWLAQFLPHIEARFHYRNVDVSSVKELAKRWYSDARPTTTPRAQHRAYPDLLDTIDELAHYQGAVFQPMRLLTGA